MKEYTLEEIKEKLEEIWYRRKEEKQSDRNLVMFRWCTGRGGYVKEESLEPPNPCNDPECPECKFQLQCWQEVIEKSKYKLK